MLHFTLLNERSACFIFYTTMSLNDIASIKMSFAFNALDNLLVQMKEASGPKRQWSLWSIYVTQPEKNGAQPKIALADRSQEFLGAQFIFTNDAARMPKMACNNERRGVG